MCGQLWSDKELLLHASLQYYRGRRSCEKFDTTCMSELGSDGLAMHAGNVWERHLKVGALVYVPRPYHDLDAE